MTERRLTPEQLRARLQANLANASARGTAPSESDQHGLNAQSFAEPDSAKSGVSPPLNARLGTYNPSPKGRTDSLMNRPSAPNDSPATRAVNATLNPDSVRHPPSANETIESTLLTNSASEKRIAHPIVHRHETGGVLRGYRIPLALHRRAERAKLAASGNRRAMVFWDEILQTAIDELPKAAELVSRFETDLPSEFAKRSQAAQPAGVTRVLQATIRHDQDMLLRALRLDLEELTGSVVRLEEIWTWLIRTIVESPTQPPPEPLGTAKPAS